MGFSYHHSGKFLLQTPNAALKGWELATTRSFCPFSALGTQTIAPSYGENLMKFYVDKMVEMSKMILLLNKKMWKSWAFLRIVVTKRLLSSK